MSLSANQRGSLFLYTYLENEGGEVEEQVSRYSVLVGKVLIKDILRVIRDSGIEVIDQELSDEMVTIVHAQDDPKFGGFLTLMGHLIGASSTSY